MNDKFTLGVESLNRIKYIMEYDSNKTSVENLISEQTAYTNSLERADADPFKKDAEIMVRRAEEKAKQYPNWCRYPDKALGIPKNPEGAEGEDAILIDKKTGKRFCYYPSPSNQKMGEISSIPIPEDSPIAFWDVEGISDTVNKFSKDYPKDDKKLLISNLSKVLPIGTVRQFVVGEENYLGYLSRTEGDVLWRFGYYRNFKTKAPYTPPEWVDERSDYQRFVDDYGFAIQITAALATAAAGFFTGGAAWVLYAEIVIEIGVGAAVGFREIEKGENVSAALSFITGVLPMLKLSKMFRGIPNEVFAELSEKLSKAGLTKSSNVEDYVKFYNGLSESEQIIMNKLLRQDDVTKNLLLKELKTSLSDDLPKIMIKEFENMIKTNPELLKSISFFNRLWVRELSTNALFVLLGITVNAAWGDVLNSEDLEKLKGIYQNIPEELQKEMAFNLFSNDAEVLKKLPQTESVKKIESFTNLNKKGKSWGKYYNTVMKDSIQEAGGVYKELPEDENKSADNKKGSVEDEKKLRKEGFIPFSELKNEQTVYDYTKLNGVDWFKVNR